MPEAIPAPRPHRRVYDHRLREQVCRGNLRSVAKTDIPRSMIKSWRRRGAPRVITLEPHGTEQQDQAATIAKLENRVQVLAAVVPILLAFVRSSGFTLAAERLPDGAAKAGILRAVASAERALPLTKILKIIRLSPSRYHAWRGRKVQACGLDDRPSCPRSRPAQLTVEEIASVKEMVLDPNNRHMPLGTLARHAQRIGKVFASAATWGRLVRERGWRRPRQRIHPAKPTVGIRATKPNELWHIDVSIIKLLDGTKTYIHAVIDNHSRKILAWTIDARLDPLATCAVLIEAGKCLCPGPDRPTLMADSGVENVNAAVDANLLESGIRRILAQVDVSESNSMIEAFWRSLKPNWLFLNSLDSMERLRSLVAFFVDAHNSQMPHSAFQGHTPNEIFAGSAPNLARDLANKRLDARQRRLAANRALSCSNCAEFQPLSNRVHLHPPNS